MEQSNVVEFNDKKEHINIRHITLSNNIKIKVDNGEELDRILILYSQRLIDPAWEYESSDPNKGIVRLKGISKNGDFCDLTLLVNQITNDTYHIHNHNAMIARKGPTNH